MRDKSNVVYRFGDLLALARQSWIQQMASELVARGYDDYRRSDSATMRHLQRGPTSIGRLGTALGISRQAARKVADGLKVRGFVRMQQDSQDGRQVNIILTRRGEAYAKEVTDVIEGLNRALARRVKPADLLGADTVLRAVLSDDHSRRLADGVEPPPATRAYSRPT